jgi:hypothetical protein
MKYFKYILYITSNLLLHDRVKNKNARGTFVAVALHDDHYFE